MIHVLRFYTRAVTVEYRSKSLSFLSGVARSVVDPDSLNPDPGTDPDPAFQESESGSRAFLWVIFALMDPDLIRIRIHNTGCPYVFA